MLALLLQALTVTLVDIDNAMFTTDQLSGLGDRRRLVNFQALSLEFIGRLLLLLLFLAVAGARSPLLQIGGYPLSLETVALLAAGGYLVITNGRDILEAVRAPAGARAALPEPPANPAAHLFTMGLVLTLLSVDTVLLIVNTTTLLADMLVLLLFSAVVRLLFVDRLVALIESFPNITVFINGLLILIGLQLLLQALGIDYEPQFNGVIIMVVVALIAAHWLTKRETSAQGKQ